MFLHISIPVYKAYAWAIVIKVKSLLIHREMSAYCGNLHSDTYKAKFNLH